MKRSFAVLSLSFLLFCAVWTVCAIDETGVKAEVNIYSGRMPPEWYLLPGELQELSERLDMLPSAEPVEIPEWGYVAVTREDPESGFPYSQVYLFDGLIAANNGSVMRYYRDVGGVMDWLVELGNKHDPNVSPATTLPEGTPRMAVIQKSLEGGTLRGEELRSKITVFSEGTAPLSGSIMLPDFMSGEVEVISLPAGGSSDYVFYVNTSKPGNLSGEIRIESNDPQNPLIVVPVDFEVRGKLLPGPQEPGGQDLMGYALYAVLFILLLVIAALLIMRKRKKERELIEKEREEFLRWKGDGSGDEKI